MINPGEKTVIAGSEGVMLAALSGEVGGGTEMLPTKAEQVSDDGACAAG